MRFRVIDRETGEEADTEKIALSEDWAKRLVYCDIEGFAILEDGCLVLLDECGSCVYCPYNRFEVEFLDDDGRPLPEKHDARSS